MAKNVNVTENIEEAVGVTTPAASTQEAKNNSDTEARIKQLEQQNQQLTQQLSMFMAMFQNGNFAMPRAKEEKIKIIHLMQTMPGLETTITLSNLVINLSNFGEERSLTLQQFEELVGRYRAWFANGTIAVANGYEDYAETYGVRAVKNFPINGDFFKNLGSLSITKIEEVFPKLPEACKGSVIALWIRKALEGDPQFRDIRKLETLNRLTDGSLTQMIAEFNAKPTIK